MTLPASGTITGANILTELNASSLAFNDVRLLRLAHKTALPLSMSDFYGRSAWQATGSAVFASAAGRTGFANQPGLGIVFGSLNPQAFRSVALSAIYDVGGSGVIEMSSIQAQDYWYSIVVNGVHFYASNAQFGQIGGGYPRSQWSFNTNFGFTNGGPINIEIFY